MKHEHLLSGTVGGLRFRLSEPVVRCIPEAALSAQWRVVERDAACDLQLTLANSGDVPVEMTTLAFRYAVDGEKTPAHPVDTKLAENYFICTGFSADGRALVLMPLFRTQFELAERTADGAYTVYFVAHDRRYEGNLEAAELLLPTPPQTLTLQGGESILLSARVFAAPDLDAARSLLRRNGMLADRIFPGVNAAFAPRTDFFQYEEDTAYTHRLANDQLCATLSQGRLTSLSATEGSVEFMDAQAGFGDFALVLQDGACYDTSTMKAREKSENTFVCTQEALRILRTCTLEGDMLTFRCEICNDSDKPLRISDLRMPFPVNSHVGLGENASRKVLRHQQIAGDNSFFLFTPCDGQAPYLLCLPEDGTRFELFDSPDGAGEFRAYIRAEGMAATAAAKGCCWRQPVSGETVAPGESFSFALNFMLVASYQEARNRLVQQGLCDVEMIPGLTLPRATRALCRVRCRAETLRLEGEFADETEITLLSRQGEVALFEIIFHHLGENRLMLHFDGRYGVVETFVTLPFESLIQLRGAFIANHQIRDESRWYNGLLAEVNNETGAVLSPDAPDGIRGWRVYEFSCDDPALAKPAFLSAKNAEYPVPKEIEALEYYIAHYVWGGLQRTEAEEYPYAIYGIPQWHSLRGMRNVNSTELAHLWRAYDYPHIAQTYFNLYRIGRMDDALLHRQTKEVYLERAYRTLLAMFLYPVEIGHEFVGENGIYATGFYNELCIPDVVEALMREGRQEAAARLRYHWQKKADAFVLKCQDLFRSEMAFDTTGFETTQAVVNWARKNAAHTFPMQGVQNRGYGVDDVERFAKRQTMCNIACRGYLENAYYLRGSDIRGNSARYTLSYMSQMGGWSLMEEALYGPGDPFWLLRLASASASSSWALCNAGDEASRFGYWFPGEGSNGAAGGGFEPAPFGRTWLEQPHHRGSWYYSCEIDLGFCGGLRAANTVLADDPDFGLFCYGGTLVQEADGACHVTLRDGVNRRFHRITRTGRIHVLAENAHIRQVTLLPDGRIICRLTDVRQHAVLCAWRQGEPVHRYPLFAQKTEVMFAL